MNLTSWLLIYFFQKLYRYLFWLGYLAVLLTAFVPIAGDLSRIKLGRGFFEIRLDHLLHFSAYFLITMYYLFGRWKGYALFEKRPMLKFAIAVMVLATVTEFVQLWVPARAFNVMDWVANMAGIVFGLIVIKIQDLKFKKED